MKRYLPFTLFFWSTLASANLIFPLFTTPYIISIFIPVILPIVFIIESIVYRKTSNGTLSWSAIVLLVLVANLISWVIGIIIAAFIPDDIININNFLKDSYHTPSVIFSFILAYIFSVIIEGTVLKFGSKKLGIEKPFYLSLYANTCSYGALSIISILLKLSE